MHPAQFSVFESSSDLSYCDSLSQHRHLLAGKGLFLLHKTFLVQGKNVGPLLYQMCFLSQLGKSLFAKIPDVIMLLKKMLSLQPPQV